MKVGDIFVALGFSVDDKKLDSFDKGIQNLQKDILKLTAGVTASLYAIDRFVDSSVRAAASFISFTSQTGKSAQALQRYQLIATLNTISLSADDVTSSIMNLQQELTKISLGQGNPAAVWLNVQTTDAFEALDQIRKKIQSGAFSDSMATNLIQQMGLSPDFMQIFKLPDSAFKQLSDKLFIKPGVIDSLKRTGLAVNLLKKEWDVFQTNITAKLEPFWKMLIQLLESAGDVIGRMVEHIGGLSTGFLALGAAMIALAPIFKVLNIALLPLMTTLTTLLLIFDDFATFMNGGDSVIGRIKNYFGNDAGFDQRRSEQKSKTERNNFERQKQGYEPYSGMKKYSASELAGGYAPEIDYYARDSKTASNMSDPEKAKALIDLFGSVPDGAYMDDLPGTPTYDAQGNLTGMVPEASGGATSNSKSVEQNNTFHVQSDDPDATASAIGNTLQRQLNHGLADQNNGAVY